MSTTVKLNYINRSNDVNNSQIVIFQKNIAPSFDELAVAWKVIKNCGQGDNHPFTFPHSFSVGASDSWGNYTPKFSAEYGQQWEMIKDQSGDILKLSSAPHVSIKEVAIANNLTQGAINAGVYKDGSLLATKTNIVPGQKSVFEFKPTIWIGIVSQIEEGEVLNSAIISQINTEISLLGISSADIVMTGGGSGAEAKPFSFALENVVVA
ncbi:MAG: hypothetical protein R2800_04475 [Flavipsychrobacter sp.]